MGLPSLVKRFWQSREYGRVKNTYLRGGRLPSLVEGFWQIFEYKILLALPALHCQGRLLRVKFVELFWQI